MACFVKNCKNVKRLLPLNSGITFHRFPTDELMYKKWLKAIGRDKEKKVRTQNMLLCSDHFCLEDFVYGRGVRRVKKNAVPLSNKFLEENIPSASPNGPDSEKFSFETVTDDFNLYPHQKNTSKCAVIGCINRSSKKSLEQLERESSGIRISFHKFPDSVDMKTAWVNAIRRTGWSPGKYSVICSDHFTNNCFDKSPFTTTLLPNSIPTIFPSTYYNRRVSENSETDSETMDNEFYSMLEQPPIMETIILPSTSSVSTSTDDLLSNGYRESSNGNLTSNKSKRRSAVEEFKHKTSMYEKKIEILIQKNKQQQKTIATLKNVLAILNHRNKTKEL